MFALAVFALGTIATAFATPPPEGGCEPKWKLVLSDDFSAPALDTSKWDTCYPDGCTHGTTEAELYAPANLVFRNPGITLQARNAPGATLPYTSGMLFSKQTFTYAYMEMRGTLPKGVGLWPAFWTVGGPPYAEIDTFENLGNPLKLYFTVHYLDVNRTQHPPEPYTTPDLSMRPHTFGLDWRPDRIVWYVDDQQAFFVVDRSYIPAGTLSVIANLAVGGPGSWPGPPDTQTTFPANFDIDYIRVWQQEASCDDGNAFTADTWDPASGCRHDGFDAGLYMGAIYQLTVAH